MTEPAGDRPAIRIGTAERNAALKALDAHLEAGRLDAMEYGERSAQVAEARTADEVRPLFTDLPEPHPQLPGDAPGVGAAAPAPAPSGGAPAGRSTAGLATWGPRLAAVMPFVAVALFFATGAHFWWLFLLIPAAGALFARSRDGDHDEHEDRADGHREERRAVRDERHQLRDQRHEPRHERRERPDR